MAEILPEQEDFINGTAKAQQKLKEKERAEKEASLGVGGKKLPKGVVLGPDGKPCRSCTSFRDWAAMTRSSTSKPKSSSSKPTSLPVDDDPAPPADCPPDIETLGRSTWTLLHTIAASYPTRASPSQQATMSTFLSSFAQLYPCHTCAEDFRSYLKRPGNSIEQGLRENRNLKGRSELGMWLCQAHNEVNRKLGKGEFDCAKWEERWRTGWRDGRCD